MPGSSFSELLIISAHHKPFDFIRTNRTSTTDDQGVYRFKTIKPGPYAVSESWTRPPHIHFDVSGRNGRVVTQMYFEDEPLNGPDRLLKGTHSPELLVARYQAPGTDMEPDSLSAVWDIVLPES